MSISASSIIQQNTYLWGRGYQMALPAFKEAFDAMNEAPPPVDWEAAFQLVNDLNDLQKAIASVEQSTAIWRAGMHERLATGLAVLDKAAEGFPKSTVYAELVPIMQPGFEALEDGMETFSKPLHEQMSAEVLAKLAGAGGPAGRFIRKLMKRAEDVRVKQYNAHVEFFYTLMAFRDQFEPQDHDVPAFTSGKEIGAFLRESLKAG